VECPPPGPFGYEPGATVTDLTLLDCDGAPVSLHDLCGASAGLVVNFYGWCPSCYDFLRLANELTVSRGDRGFRAIAVVSENPIEEPATAEYCRAIRARFAPAATVVYDPDGAIEAYGTTDLAMVTDRSAKIVFKRRDATERAVTTAVDRELAK